MIDIPKGIFRSLCGRAFARALAGRGLLSIGDGPSACCLRFVCRLSAAHTCQACLFNKVANSETVVMANKSNLVTFHCVIKLQIKS